MALKDNVKNLRELLAQITHDLEKADKGNKAASQRVRTGTVRLEKVAKVYRKESIRNEKTSSKSPRKSASKKGGTSAKTKARPTAAQSKGKAKPKARTQKATVKARALSFRRSTAKIPQRKR